MQTTIKSVELSNLIYVGIGANLPSSRGSPLDTCREAIEAIKGCDVRVISQSRWYESAPVPRSSQPWFINGVAAVDSALDPAALLSLLHDVEERFGRERSTPNAARILDLDLLDYRGLLRHGAPPELPHPRLAERAFVLLPLGEIAPHWRHPRSGAAIASLIDALGPDQIAAPLV